MCIIGAEVSMTVAGYGRAGAVFEPGVGDALDPVADEALHAAADDLTARLARLGPDVRAARRLMAADHSWAERP